MANLVAIVGALFKIFTTGTMFERPTASSAPLLSLCIFLLSLSLLIYTVPLHPRFLRKYGKHVYGLFEVFTTSFIMDVLVSYFWMPLEEAAMGSASFLADVIEDITEIHEDVCQTLRHKAGRYLMSYAVSVLFLLLAMHVTRLINIQIFQYIFGPYADNHDRDSDGDAGANISVQSAGSSGIQVKANPILKTPQNKRGKRELQSLRVHFDGNNSDISAGDRSDSGRRVTRSFSRRRASQNRRSIF